MTQQPTRDRRRLIIAGLLAANLVVMIAIAAVLITRDDAEPSAASTSTTTTTTVAITTTSEPPTTTSTSEASTTTTTSSSTTTTSTTTTTTTTLIVTSPEGRAAAAVASWLQALAEGTADEAWALVGAASQQAIGGRDGFDALYSALVEGQGEWSRATDPNGTGSPWTFVNRIDGQIYAVTLAGIVTQEGVPDATTIALPVIVSGEVATVEPFLRVDPVQVVGPPFFDEPWELVDQPPVTFSVRGAPGVRVYVGSSSVSVTTEGAAGTTRITTAPLTQLEAGGQYVITVVVLDEGVIHADAFLVVAGESS